MGDENDKETYFLGLSEELLQKTFAQFGAIQEIRIFKDKGYAFVRYHVLVQLISSRYSRISGMHGQSCPPKSLIKSAAGQKQLEGNSGERMAKANCGEMLANGKVMTSTTLQLKHPYLYTWSLPLHECAYKL